jgi:putative tryptophan/tyrosine transport system substrate-binding protein
MRRRTFLTALGGAVFAWPLGGRAQPAGKTYRAGYLFLGAQPPDSRKSPPWPTLRELGYVEGTNLIVERRFAAGRRDRLAAFASELVALKPDVILAQGAQSAEAASSATREIPIVVMGVGDPVGIGLAKSLAHPGGNVTGVAELSTVLSPKRLELLSEAIPGVSQVAMLWNAADPAMALRYREIESAAKTMHIEIRPLAVREPEDFDDAFAAMRRDRPGAMFMITDALTNLNRKRIVQFAAENRLPAIYESRDPVDDGGLMSYGPILPDIFARTAYFIDKILKGAKPGDLPMEQPTNFELVVNLKTAKLLNLELPPILLARADAVIK